MANFNNLSLTVSGIKALLEAQTGKTLTLSKLGLGSGTSTNVTSLKNLVTPKVMIPISETNIDSDQGFMTVIAKMTNEIMTEGFYWKETGLFFKDSSGNNVLFAYACITDDKYDYIPAYSDQHYVKNIRIANIITNTANITVEESEGLVYVDTVTFSAYKEEVAAEIGDVTIKVNGSVKYGDVVDNLLSDRSDLPLSAKQGLILKEGQDELSANMIKIMVLSNTLASLNAGASAQVEFTYSGVTKVYAAIPYTLGGIPLTFSVNGATNEKTSIFVRNDSGASYTDRIIKLVLFYI